MGVTLADATYMLIFFFGVSSLLSLKPVRLGVWLLGACALGYLGLRSVLEARKEIGLEASDPVTARNPLLVGYLVNISNPIAVVWWLGVFGSLLAESGVSGSRLVAFALSSSILVGILVWHSTVSLLTHWGEWALGSPGHPGCRPGPPGFSGSLRLLGLPNPCRRLTSCPPGG